MIPDLIDALNTSGGPLAHVEVKRVIEQKELLARFLELRGIQVWETKGKLCKLHPRRPLEGFDKFADIFKDLTSDGLEQIQETVSQKSNTAFPKNP